MARPSAFAVLRLITSSYFVGACTGRSAGFSRSAQYFTAGGPAYRTRGDQSPGGETILNQWINAAVQAKIPMSALPPKADMEHTCRDVRFVPKADIAPNCHLWRCDHRKATGPNRTPAASRPNKA